ncbi:MAG: NAD(P)(+) transhydrogenase (Re/Si-specific) subunit beta [Lentisphaerae bacterium]|nr:NAD(P)(+) transhydrogenase (Re/Si-specific) subunit beta [Lentisphaerota bacterium]
MSVAPVVSLVLIAGVLLGIRWMGSPTTARRGNLVSALCMAGFIAMALVEHGLLRQPWIWAALAVGTAAGLGLGLRVRMIQMPEMVALLNGLGGGASAIVAWMEVTGAVGLESGPWSCLAGGLGVGIGGATLSGSLVAAGRLARWLPQRPWRARALGGFNLVLLAGLGAVLIGACSVSGPPRLAWTAALAILAVLLGVFVVLRVGGADMPVTISLLNSLSGVAAAFTGFAIMHPVLVAVGGIVGAAGLVLTLIMCRAMNRRLGDILTGRTTAAGLAAPAPAPAAGAGPAPVPDPTLPAAAAASAPAPDTSPAAPPAPPRALGLEDAVRGLREARRVVLVPGYGMALAQAQADVKGLYEALVKAGKEVCFAIHPVAGRMPGHMHVLLAEVDIPYELFLEMEAANPRFAEADVAVIVGANDVVNPAANTAVGTPIYGMPVLAAGAARLVVVCNLNADPGYAGVRNPLYDSPEKVALLFGDARETVSALTRALTAAPA